jgi:hypothetical protein
MAAKFRRTLIAAQYLPSSPRRPSPEEITAVHLAWAAAAAA